MSPRQRASSMARHRPVRRLCIAAAIVAAGSSALTIEAGSAGAVPEDAEGAAASEARHIVIGPQDRVGPEHDPRPDDVTTAELVARFETIPSVVSLRSEPEMATTVHAIVEFEPWIGESDPTAPLPPEPVTDHDADQGSDTATEPAPSTDPGDEPEHEPAAEGEPEPEVADEVATPTNVPLETWEAVARCESGYGGEPDWSINTGNGYYGGLQFNLNSWEWVGGTGYPHEASKATQIEMAERLWERQGWDAWPACSRQLGLR